VGWTCDVRALSEGVHIDEDEDKDVNNMHRWGPNLKTLNQNMTPETGR